jgi:hypothetical protein
VTFNGIGNFPAPAAKPATGSLSVTGHSVKQRTLTVTKSGKFTTKVTVSFVPKQGCMQSKTIFVKFKG